MVDYKNVLIGFFIIAVVLFSLSIVIGEIDTIKPKTSNLMFTKPKFGGF